MAKTQPQTPRPIRPPGLPNTDGIMRPSTRGKELPQRRQGNGDQEDRPSTGER
jgi:hypothetical protein